MFGHAKSAQDPPAAQSADSKPDLFALALGFFDARISGGAFFDTVGGHELMRIVRHRVPALRPPGRRRQSGV